MSDTIRNMTAVDILDAEKSDTVKVLTIQVQVTIDGKFDGGDCNRALARALSDSDCLAEDRDPSVSQELEPSDWGLHEKLHAIAKMEALFEVIGDIHVIGEETHGRES